MVAVNYFSASGQSTTTIDNATLTKMVLTCEKCQADLDDYELIVEDQKLILEAQSVRLIEMTETNEGLNLAIEKLKTAYDNLERKHRKKRFWIWIKGVGVGIITGAILAVALLI